MLRDAPSPDLTLWTRSTRSMPVFPRFPASVTLSAWKRGCNSSECAPPGFRYSLGGSRGAVPSIGSEEVEEVVEDVGMTAGERASADGLPLVAVGAEFQ
jgi:hypothetical protein